MRGHKFTASILLSGLSGIIWLGLLPFSVAILAEELGRLEITEAIVGIYAAGPSWLVAFLFILPFTQTAGLVMRGKLVEPDGVYDNVFWVFAVCIAGQIIYILSIAHDITPVPRIPIPDFIVRPTIYLSIILPWAGTAVSALAIRQVVARRSDPDIRT